MPRILSKFFHLPAREILIEASVLLALLCMIFSPPAFAGNTNFLTEQNGAITFPFSPPNKSSGANATIDATDIGQTTPGLGNFSSGGTTGLGTFGSIKVDTGTKTATAVAGAATLNKNSGVITTEALTTAGLADYTLTLTNSAIGATDAVLFSIQNGTNSAGDPVTGVATVSAGQVIFIVRNAHATSALNGTLKIGFMTLKN